MKPTALGLYVFAVPERDGKAIVVHLSKSGKWRCTGFYNSLEDARIARDATRRHHEKMAAKKAAR